MAIEEIIDKLKSQHYRSSTRRNYYGIWKTFNQFIVRLDEKPTSWEERIILFVGNLINEGKKSATVKSYVSAVKAILTEINVKVNEDRCLLNSLTRACKLTNDTTIRITLPIQQDMLNAILKKTKEHFLNNGQVYLAKMYTCLFATAYFGLFRVRELTESEHTIKACDVYMGTNKDQVLFILRSSKTRTRGDPPQLIKISKISHRKTAIIPDYCPYKLMREYLACRPEAENVDENFFVFRDGSPIKPTDFSLTLKAILKLAKFDESKYSTKSLRSGRAMDLMRLGFSVETIKKLGRWRSNAVYAYLR